MERTNKLLCPSCRTPLKSARGVRIGRKIKCPQCQVAFTVRPEDAEKAARLNPGRLGGVVALVLLYLLGGAGLAFWCFANNAPRNRASPVTSSRSSESEDDEAPAPLPLPAPGALSTREQRQIDDGIARGVWYLKTHQLPTGTWSDTLQPYDDEVGISVGFAALPALTLLECGVPVSDPIVQKAANLVRQQAPQPAPNRDTYQVSLAILFLDRLGDKNDEELIQYLALCLLAGMHPQDGAWTYPCPRLDRKMVPQLLQLLKDNKQSLDDWRKTALQGAPFEVPGWDNSNTQFAVLALWVAQRHHVPINGTIALVKKHFLSTQQPDGSWCYNAGAGPAPWSSMTCAGLLGVAVAHGLAGKSEPLEDQAIRNGLTLLGREIDRPEETRALDLYFLWSLERVSVLYNLRKIGDRDWYAWGSKALLAKQQPDGSWKDGGYPGSVFLSDTCFALLFLKQANLAKDLSAKLKLLGGAK